jgi:hypothetical protein
LTFLRALFTTRLELVAENLALRQQLAILNRTAKLGSYEFVTLTGATPALNAGPNGRKSDFVTETQKTIARVNGLPDDRN